MTITYVNIIGWTASLLTVGLLIYWMRQNRKVIRWTTDCLDAADKLNTYLRAASDELTTAGLALCTAMHSHYHVDDEAFPGLIMVKCMDCKETIGSVSERDDVMALANVHVREKYEAMRQQAAEQAAQEKEEREKVKQDQV